MLLLHTADWHLGRTLHRADLHEAQASALDALVEAAADARPDAIVVAGDLYDRAIPPVDAVALAGDALARLAEHAPVLLITGNHDSAGRLGPYGPLMRAAGVHVRAWPQPAEIGTPLLVEDRHGTTALYGIPYLEPAVARAPLDAPEAAHAAVIGAAMTHVRDDLATRPIGTRSVAVAHAFVQGGTASADHRSPDGGAERDLAAGGAAAVAPDAFAGVDYVALGHLHLPQAVGGRARYAGSPVAYSFVEGRTPRSAVLAELDAGGTIAHEERIPLPAWRPMAELRGELEALLADPAHERVRDAWLRVVLTDAERPAAPMERLRRRFPHVLVLEHEPAGAAEASRAAESYARRTRGRADEDVVHGFVRDVRGREADEEDRALLGRAMAAGRRRADRLEAA